MHGEGERRRTELEIPDNAVHEIPRFVADWTLQLKHSVAICIDVRGLASGPFSPVDPFSLTRRANPDCIDGGRVGVKTEKVSLIKEVV